MQKKAQMNKLTGFALGIVVFAVVLAVGFSVLENLRDNLSSTSQAHNQTGRLISYMAEIPGWLPVIIVAMVGGLVLFLVIKQFGGGS